MPHTIMHSVVVLSDHDHEITNPQALYLAAALAEDGYRVTFVAPLSGNALYYLQARNVRVVRINHHWPKHEANLFFFGHYLFLLTIYILKLMFSIPRSTDLILAINQSPCRAAWFLHRFGWTHSYVGYLLEIWDRWLRPSDMRGFFNRMVWSRCELAILSNDARCRLFEDAHPKMAGRTVVLHNVQPSDWPGRPLRPISNVEGPLLLGYIGSIYKWTRLSLMLEAIAACQHPIRLLIGGIVRDPSYMKELELKVSEWRLDSQVTFVGPVPRDRLPDLIEQVHATVCFYPWRSKADINFQLCAPNKIYESLALGRPVIASDNPTLSFLEEQGMGWNVDIEQPPELVRLLDALAENREAVIAAGQRAHQVCQETLNFEIDSATVRQAIGGLVHG
jgi:glycosyltransferase involved in cell wall biosynthesis